MKHNYINKMLAYSECMISQKFLDNSALSDKQKAHLCPCIYVIHIV